MTTVLLSGEILTYGGIVLAVIGLFGLIISSVLFTKKKKKTLDRISKDL